MPVVLPPSRILVTGASGFLGSWIIRTLFEKGFTVRAAVRSEEKADFLKNRFRNHADKLEFTIFKEYSPGVFSDAVKGVAGILHAGSPMPSKELDEDPQVHIKPAVEGTLEVLKSASTQESVKRIVITSSAVTLFEPRALPFTYTEEIWNETAVKIVEQRGKEAPPYAKYTTSKVLAERAAWDYMKDHPSTSYDLVTILPTFIWGPIISQTTENIRGSNDYLLGPLKKSALENRTRHQNLMELRFVDSRDLAEMHVQALLAPEAGGERIIASAHSVTWQHIFDILNASPVEGVKVPQGDPGLLKEDWEPSMKMSQEKSKSLLKANYRPADATIRETISDAVQIGWRQ